MTSSSRLSVVSDPHAIELNADRLTAALADPVEELHAPDAARELAASLTRMSAAARSQRERLAPLTGRPLAAVVVWACAALAALAAAQMGASVTVGIAAAGALVSLTLLRGPLATRVVTAAAMLPIAVAATAPSIAWVLAGVLVAGVAASSERPLIARSQDLQRHLDWCRRREEDAHVLVVIAPDTEECDERGLLEAFRLTDSVAITHQRGRREIHAVIDDHRLSREGLERRVIQEVGGDVSFGWAAFPEDGYTLDVLLEQAASGLAAAPAEQRTHAVGRLEPISQPA